MMPDSKSNAGEPAFDQRVLIAEDLEDTRVTLQHMLRMSLQMEVDAAADGAEALQMLLERPYSVLVTDLRMPKMTGMQLIEEIRDRRLPVTVIVTTGHGRVNDAVTAIQMGAYDFLLKPAEPEQLTRLIQRAVRERSLQDEVIALRHSLQNRWSFQNIISKNQRMLEIFDLIANLSDNSSTVLIMGETGTGKEQIARAIHNSCKLRTGPMVAINCAALPETLLESELFGHEKGSFTGAIAQRIGRFEQANNGTVFLDEVGDVPVVMQVKLLRVLQERTIERIGGRVPIDIDVRVIAATHQPLESRIKENKFREDLFYRLNVIRIEIPPLRDRPEDIPLLAAHFCSRYSKKPTDATTISPTAMEVLMRHEWPGNVRQLENAIESACIIARDGVIQPEHLPPDLRRQGGRKQWLQVDINRPLPEQLAEITGLFERRYLRRALKRTRGHVGKAAEITGLSRRSITDKLSQYNINKDEFKN